MTAVGDADTLIVNTALEMAQKTRKSIRVIGTDADLLVFPAAGAPKKENSLNDYRHCCFIRAVQNSSNKKPTQYGKFASYICSSRGTFFPYFPPNSALVGSENGTNMLALEICTWTAFIVNHESAWFFSDNTCACWDNSNLAETHQSAFTIFQAVA
ncbi:hypothetical protein GQR58_015994 [Nymphon striatum]|nr:hypothetical protein GQR58_015994 [Nymphon striatum]